MVLPVVCDSLGASSCSPTHQFLNWVFQVLFGYEKTRWERGGESSGIWTTASTVWREPHTAGSKFRTSSLWLAKRTGMSEHVSKESPCAQHGAQQAIPSYSWSHKTTCIYLDIQARVWVYLLPKSLLKHRWIPEKRGNLHTTLSLVCLEIN